MDGQADIAGGRFSAMPSDILLNIMGRVAKSSIKELVSFYLSCKLILSLLKEKCIYREVEVGSFGFVPTDRCPDSKRKLWRLAIESGNPMACYMQALADVFLHASKPNLVQAALQNIEVAIASGNDDPRFDYAQAIFRLMTRDRALILQASDFIFELRTQYSVEILEWLRYIIAEDLVFCRVPFLEYDRRRPRKLRAICTKHPVRNYYERDYVDYSRICAQCAGYSELCMYTREYPERPYIY